MICYNSSFVSKAKQVGTIDRSMPSLHSTLRSSYCCTFLNIAEISAVCRGSLYGLRTMFFSSRVLFGCVVARYFYSLSFKSLSIESFFMDERTRTSHRNYHSHSCIIQQVETARNAREGQHCRNVVTVNANLYLTKCTTLWRNDGPLLQ
jgi:hypothetical protein